MGVSTQSTWEGRDGNDQEMANLKELKTNALNGMWIDETDDQKPLEEIGEIYSIESGYISDGGKKVAVKMRDTDQVEIDGFKANDWRGAYDGSFPDDKINWGGKNWIRLKHEKMIKDLEQIKKKLQDLAKEMREKEKLETD